MKRLFLEVTQEDIDNGVRGEPDHCPVALAAQRKAHGRRSSTGYRTVTVGGSVFYASGRLTKWIYAFDDGRTVRPGRFVLSRDYE